MLFAGDFFEFGGVACWIGEALGDDDEELVFELSDGSLGMELIMVGVKYFVVVVGGVTQK